MQFSPFYIRFQVCYGVFYMLWGPIMGPYFQLQNGSKLIFSCTSDWLSVLRIMVERRSFEKINLFMWNRRNQVFRNWDSSHSIKILHASHSRYWCWYLDLHTKGTFFSQFSAPTLISFRRRKYGKHSFRAREKSKFDPMVFHQCHWRERHQMVQSVAILSKQAAHNIWGLGWELMMVWD